LSDSSPIVHSVLFIAIPVHNEVETIGVLLWRLRSVLAEFPRDYEVVVYDDASTDGTQELLEGYAKVLPLTVLRGEKQVGYAQALDHLLRHAVTQTRHPRRDAVLLLQGDFTDPPGLIPEFARRFEGGADLVVGERTTLADAPVAVQRLFRLSGWSMRPFVRIDGLQDVTSSLRLVRIATVRDLLRERGDAPLVEGDSWTANADLLLRLVPYARRVETVPVQSTYGVRVRETRRIAARDAMAALKWAWAARKRRVQVLAAEVEPSRTRDEPRLTLSRNESDERPTRPRNRGGVDERAPRSRTQPDDEERTSARPRRQRDASTRGRERVDISTPTRAPDSSSREQEIAVGSEAQQDEPRRKRRKRGTRRTPVVDTTAETLALVDPAAGIAPELEPVDDINDVGADDADAMQRPRRKKRRRRKRSRDVNGETTQTGDGESASAIGDDLSPYRDDRDDAAHDGAHDAADDSAHDVERDDDADRSTRDAGAETADDVGDSEAARARRRGRRGRRGGRRTRRTRDGNGAPGESDTAESNEGGSSDSQDGSASGDSGSDDE
jgi:hypothetical protein